VDTGIVKAKFESLACALDERGRRLWAATEAKAIGYGGIALVSRATGVSYSTIRRGLKELKSGPPQPGRIRRPGGGRKKTLAKDSTLLADLDGLVEPTASGDPQSPLRWTSKSVRTLARELQAMGHDVSHQLVLELLYAEGYSLQANRKSREGSNHPDRDAQFRYIQRKVRRFQGAGQPVISVDTKKKELVGNFKNAGKQWRPKGTPEPVRVHDFRIPELGKAIPYGVYDLTRNAGWVSVGIDHDDRTLVAEDGTAAVPRHSGPADHGGCGRKQRCPHSLVEMGTSTLGQPYRAFDYCVPLSARDEQVEQDRASTVLLHQHELARASAGVFGGDRQPDRLDTNARGVAGPMRIGQGTLPERAGGLGRADGNNPSGSSSLPPRLELHDSSSREELIRSVIV
jgi:hypothetical protein